MFHLIWYETFPWSKSVQLCKGITYILICESVGCVNGSPGRTTRDLHYTCNKSHVRVRYCNTLTNNWLNAVQKSVYIVWISKVTALLNNIHLHYSFAMCIADIMMDFFAHFIHANLHQSVYKNTTKNTTKIARFAIILIALC